MKKPRELGLCLQLLAQGPTSFCRTTGLNAHYLHQVDDTTGVFHLILFTGKNLDLYGHRRIWFLFTGMSAVPGGSGVVAERLTDDWNILTQED